MELSVDERVEILAAMSEVAREGLSAARHLQGDLYEVRANTSSQNNASKIGTPEATLS